MANIRVDVGYPVKDGTILTFRSPVDCSAVTGLKVYCTVDGNTTAHEFMFADAMGNNVGDIDYLFAENVAVKVILDVTTGMAFVQNAATSAYIESTFVKTVNGVAPDESGNVNVEGSGAGGGIHVGPDEPTDPNINEWLDTDEEPWVIPAESLPVATETSLGAVKPVTKTADMTQPVGIDKSGALFTAPSASSGGNGVTSLIGTTEDITPTHIYAAMRTGIPFALEYHDGTYGKMVFNSAVWSYMVGNSVCASLMFELTGYAYCVQLSGSLETDTWEFKVTPLAQTKDIPDCYSKTEIDAIMGSYITDIDTLVGGDS